MGIKRDKYDKVVSDYVRFVRDRFICQRCGKKYNHGDSQGLHLSHFCSRRHSSTRYGLPDPANPAIAGLDAYNCIALCHGCHSYVGGNPVSHIELAMGLWGEDRTKEIYEQSLKPKKWKKGEKEKFVEPYRKALKKAGY